MSHSHWSLPSEGEERPEGNASGILLDLGSDQDDPSPSSSDGFEDEQTPPAAPSMDPTDSAHVGTVEIPTGHLVDVSTRSSGLSHSLPGPSGDVDQPVAHECDIKRWDYPQITTRKPSYWAKISPHIDIKENIRREQAKEEAMRANIRREQASADQPPVTMAFVWPRNGPEIEDVLGENLEKLDIFREKAGVNIYRQAEIRVVGADERTHMAVMDEIRTLYDEAVMKAELRIRAFMVEPPPGPLKAHKIALVNPDPFSRAYIRTEVSGPPYRKKTWMSQLAIESKRIQHRNHDRLVDGMKTCLTSMQLIPGLMRLRVHFGTFILNRFPKYPDEGFGFDFDDFCEKLQHERVEGRVVPGLNVDQKELFKRCSEASGLLEPMKPTMILTNLLLWDPIYSASFEFFSKTEQLTRLEVLFERTPGSWEIERKGHWWSEAKERDDPFLELPLQLGMIDFAKSDWQVDVEFFEKAEANSMKGDMEEFVKSIKFYPFIPGNSLFAPEPKRKVQTSDDVSLASVVEKTAVQFKVKNTTYILELARFDQYSGNHGTKPDKSSWGATLFDPAWDRILTADRDKIQGEVSRGFPIPREAKVNSDPFEAFFPSAKYPRADEGEIGGFDEFLDVIQKISELLRPSQDSQKIAENKPSMRGFLNVNLGTLF